MAARLVVHIAASSANANGVTTASCDTTGALLLVAMVANAQATAAATVSDSKSNTWTALTPQSVSGQARGQLFYAANPIVGSGHTFTVDTVTSSEPAIAVMAFAGISSSVGPQNGFSQAGNAVTLSTGSITPPADNALIVWGNANSQPSAPNAIDGIAIVTDQLGSIAATAFAVSAGYGVQGTAAAVNLTMTFAIATNINGSMVIASFGPGTTATAYGIFLD